MGGDTITDDTRYNSVKAKFHYTDPTGPARTQRSFAAKKVRAGPCGSGRVRVVEFSYYRAASSFARQFPASWPLYTCNRRSPTHPGRQSYTDHTTQINS